MLKADKARGTTESTRDEALKAKEAAESARAEAEVEASKDKAAQDAYEEGVTETEDGLRAQVLGVCRLYCSQVWNEALTQAGVEAVSDL